MTTQQPTQTQCMDCGAAITVDADGKSHMKKIVTIGGKRREGYLCAACALRAMRME